jgi:cell wall-associated NlpC family hydrolase
MNDELARQLSEFERVRRRAGRRVVFALGLIVLLGAATGGYYLMKTASEQQRAAERAYQATTNYERTKQELEALLFGDAKGLRRRALEEAYRLYEQKIPFKFGGKKPSEGLDTSGFVAYVLSTVGVLESPESYNVARLRERYSPKEPRKLENMRPGDLIFEANNACWLVLANGLAIGMVPGGIQVGHPTQFTSSIVAFGQVTYPDESPAERR